MAGLFGLFAGSGDRGSKPIYTLDHLQVLHNRLQNIKEDEQNRDQVVEVIRQITEAVLWGEQNGHDNSFFDFFCEKSILADFVRVLGRPNVPRTVKVQLLQTLSMLIQNIRRDTSLYYLFSSNHINHLISTQFDWNDEEILSYYISFLKSLALRLNKETIKFFFNEHTRQFPLYTEAVRFFRHHDQMVRTTVRTLTLQVYSVDDPAMRRFVLDHSAHGYFQNISVHLRRLWTKLDVTVSRAAASTGEQALVRAVQNATEQQQDLVMYIFDVLGLGITELSEVLVQNVLEQACYPALLASLLLSDVEPPSSIPPDATIDGSGLEVVPESTGLLSRSCALFLLHQLFDSCRSRTLLEPLARALLKRRLPAKLACHLRAPLPQPLPEAIWAPAASSSSSGESLASFAASSRELQDESGEIEAPEASIRYLLVGMLEGCRDDCVLLVAGLLRAALSSSSILPQALLVEAGLLPSGAAQRSEVLQILSAPSPTSTAEAEIDNSAKKRHPLEALLLAVRALEQHTSLRIVVTQGLCRLALDLASGPQARSCWSEWQAEPLAAARAATRSAARHVRTYLHGSLGDSFLDVFADEWELNVGPPPAAVLREACSSIRCLLPAAVGTGSGPTSTPAEWSLPASHSERQHATKAMRILLMIRRLHADLSRGVELMESPAEPETQPRDRVPSDPAKRSSSKGQILLSALAPLEIPKELESPLLIPEEHGDGFAEGKAFELGRQDRIVCGVVTPGGRHTRYLVLHPFLLLLVQPDLVSPGWAVVRTLAAVSQVDVQMDNSDPRTLRLSLRLGRGAKCPGEASPLDGENLGFGDAADSRGSAGTFSLVLSFEDTRRCHCAEQHLRKRRQEVRERLTKRIEAFIDGQCEL